MELTLWNCVEVNIYCHLQPFSKDIVIPADYAFSALETIICLMGYMDKCTF